MRKIAYLFAIALVAAGIAVPATAPAAEAYTVNVSASIVSSGCSAWLNWSGKMQTGEPIRDAKVGKGTVRHCSTKLRISDSNTSADYYFLDALSEINTTNRGSFGRPTSTGTVGLADAGSIRIASNTSSRSNEYGATPTKTVSGCGNVSVGVGYGPFSIGTTLNAECDQKVTRTSYTTTGAAWSVTDYAKWDRIELAFAQTVNQGVVPKYTVTYVRPMFSYNTRKVTGTYMGYQYTATVYTQINLPSSASTTTHTR